jgi:hypothetical protein
MTKDKSRILDSLDSSFEGRKKLHIFPKWIVFFTYFFAVFGGFSLIALILGFLNLRFPLSVYGLATSEPLSLTGLVILLIWFFKGIVAFSLLLGQKWAIRIAVIDAVVGILTCILTMFVIPFVGNMPSRNIEIRLELLALIPYLIIMHKKNEEWKSK